MKFQKTCKIPSNSLKYGGTGWEYFSPLLSPRQGGSGAYKVLKDIFETCAGSVLLYNGTFGITEISFSSQEMVLLVIAPTIHAFIQQQKKRGKLLSIGKKSKGLLVPVNPFIIIERLAISLLCGQVAGINYAEHMLPPGGGYQFSFGEHNRKYQFSFAEHNRKYQFSFGEHNRKYQFSFGKHNRKY